MDIKYYTQNKSIRKMFYMSMYKRNMLHKKSNLLINSQCSIETMSTVNEFIVFRERRWREGDN